MYFKSTQRTHFDFICSVKKVYTSWDQIEVVDEKIINKWFEKFLIFGVENFLPKPNQFFCGYTIFPKRWNFDSFGNSSSNVLYVESYTMNHHHQRPCCFDFCNVFFLSPQIKVVWGFWFWWWENVRLGWSRDLRLLFLVLSTCIKSFWFVLWFCKYAKKQVMNESKGVFAI